MAGVAVELVLDEELVERVGVEAGLLGEHLRRRRGRGDTEHDPAVRVELVDAGSQRGGLAGAGRSDDQHQLLVAGDRRRGLGLADGEVDARDRSTDVG